MPGIDPGSWQRGFVIANRIRYIGHFARYYKLASKILQTYLN